MYTRVGDGARLSCRVFGAGPRWLICVHGWMVSGAVFDPLVAALTDSALSIVVPDLPGTGASPPPASPRSLVGLARDVMAVADRLGATPAVWLGHSMGGQIAQLAAAMRPDAVSALVLVNPVPLEGLALPAEPAAEFRSSAGDAEKLGAVLDRATLELSAVERERLVQDALRTDSACLERYFDEFTAGVAAPGPVLAPTCVIATDDPFLPRALLERAVVSRIPKATVRFLPGPGHYPLVERPAETAALVRSFLDGLEQT